jgi:hypothetical protein
MSSKGIPEGWSIQRCDPTAGEYGEVFVHEACDGMVDAGTSYTRTALDESPNGLAVAHYHVLCEDCGVEVDIDRIEYVGLPEDESRRADPSTFVEDPDDLVYRWVLVVTGTGADGHDFRNTYDVNRASLRWAQDVIDTAADQGRIAYLKER